MSKPSPAFQFYPADWLSSQRVQMMTLEEEGAYIRLLLSCWQHGSIPASAEMCARLIGKGASTTLATVVQAMFQPHPEDGSKMVHDRLEKERQKQAEWRLKSSEGGKKSAEKRANSPSKSKGGSRVVQPPCQPKPNSSSSSSSSNSTEELTLPFPSPEFKQSWEKWTRYRKEIKKPLTASMQESQLLHLKAKGERTAIATIEHTITMGWQGLREPENRFDFGSTSSLGSNKPLPSSCL